MKEIFGEISRPFGICSVLLGLNCLGLFFVHFSLYFREKVSKEKMEEKI